MVYKLNVSNLKSNCVLYFVFIVSLIATSGSLYFSEIKEYIPCSLCWFQRIFMYPQVVISGIALIRSDKGAIYSLLPLSVIGIIFSIFHLFVENSGSNDSSFCSIGVSCAVKYINWFGFITIPLLCFTAFLMIIISILIYHFKYKK